MSELLVTSVGGFSVGNKTLQEFGSWSLRGAQSVKHDKITTKHARFKLFARMDSQKGVWNLVDTIPMRISCFKKNCAL